MSTFDIQHQLAALLGQPDRGTPTGTTVLVCLPAHCATDTAVLHTELAQRLGTGLGASAAALCPGHLYTAADLRPCEQRLVVNAQPGLGPLPGCAGAPLGLLDFTDSAALITTVAADEYDTWASIVAGTPDAIALSDLLHELAGDPVAVVGSFCAQPRIAAMLTAHHSGEVTFLLDDYGPLLAAYQAGEAEHGRYLVDVLQLGDALLELDGTLIAAAPPTQARLTHSLAQRRRYFDQARQRLRAANPTTVLVACHLLDSPQRRTP
jgi:hypothetical protein